MSGVPSRRCSSSPPNARPGGGRGRSRCSPCAGLYRVRAGAGAVDQLGLAAGFGRRSARRARRACCWPVTGTTGLRRAGVGGSQAGVSGLPYSSLKWSQALSVCRLLCRQLLMFPCRDHGLIALRGCLTGRASSSNRFGGNSRSIPAKVQAIPNWRRAAGHADDPRGSPTPYMATRATVGRLE